MKTLLMCAKAIFVKGAVEVCVWGGGMAHNGIVAGVQQA